MQKPIKIGVHALGGQGGGVLADWLVQLGTHGGHLVQATSVPGVAQRTGATVYYLEFFPESGASDAQPVLALMPVPGDVDIIVSAELMEAGRAILRGFVDAERTTLITSTHRVYAIAEKSAMGDGLASSQRMIEAARAKSARFIGFDMDALAEANGSVISSVMFGAIAGSGVLPFTRAQFEETIRASGVAVNSNLAGFAAGFDAARQNEAPLLPAQASPIVVQPRTEAGRTLHDRVITELPVAAHFLAVEGVRRLMDYQDAAYAHLYLDRLKPFSASSELSREVARALALWMSYEDTIRVADLKTRGTRFERVRGEVRAGKDQIVDTIEFMHPRYREVCETLPRKLGAWLLDSPRMEKLLAPLFRKGRFIKTTSLRGYLLLHGLSMLRHIRRATLRYAEEQDRIDAWLKGVEDAAGDSAVALELAECQRLVKGYSDTHARGLRNFALVWDAARKGRESGLAGEALAGRIRTLREAALKDEYGEALAAELNRMAA